MNCVLVVVVGMCCIRVVMFCMWSNECRWLPDLAEEQVELLARAVVSSLGQEELDLLLNLLLIQMPAVFIVHAGSCCGVWGPYTHTQTHTYMLGHCISIHTLFLVLIRQLILS